MLGLVFLGIFMLLNLVNGQLNPNQVELGCNDPRVQAGYGYLPHPIYCQSFIQCDAGLNRFYQACAPGTVYNYNIGVCVAPAQGVCNNWPCDSTRVNTTYPGLCCEQYFECTGSGFIMKNCASGQLFDMASGKCIQPTVSNKVCTDNIFCARPSNNAGGAYTCYDVPNADGNPCLYTTKTPTMDYKDRPCAYGTAFNVTTCSCSILSTVCPNSQTQLGLSGNKVKDVDCKVSLNLEFTATPLVSTSYKINPGSPYTLPYTFQTVGVSLNNGIAIFRTDPITNNDYIYSYFFNANQLATPLAISIVFKVDGTSNQVFTLLANDYNINVCQPTFSAIVTYSNNKYTVDFLVIGGTALGVNTESRISINLSGSITVPQGNFVECLMMFDGSFTALLSDRGSNGQQTFNTNTAVTVGPTNSLGAYLAYNKCGFVTGRGMNGQMSKFQVREGCSNFAKVRV